MNGKAEGPEAHVVVAKAPKGAIPIVGPALYAVVADSPAQAEAAIRAIAPSDTTLVATGGPFKPETVERLALVPREARIIG